MNTDPMRAVAEARATQTTLALVAKMDWRLDRHAPALFCASYAGYFDVPSAYLILIPTTADLPFARRQIERVIRETRSDGLIVSQPLDRPVRFAFAFWSPKAIRWVASLRLWLDESGCPSLVPVDGNDNGDGSGDGSGGPESIKLSRERIRSGPRVWAGPADYAAGCARADAWLGKVE